MKKQITLVDLAPDMLELIKAMVVGKHKSLAIQYSDDQIPDAPVAFEMAAKKSPAAVAKIPVTEDPTQTANSAAARLLQHCNASSPAGDELVASNFLRVQEIAGRLKAFFDNDAGNGILLVYEKYTFVFIVTPGDLYEYSPWPPIV